MRRKSKLPKTPEELTRTIRTQEGVMWNTARASLWAFQSSALVAIETLDVAASFHGLGERQC